MKPGQDHAADGLTDAEDFRDFDDDDGVCPQCFGEGGWASCPEDCCPAIGGEEGCTDPVCWRTCDVCRGA